MINWEFNLIFPKWVRKKKRKHLYYAWWGTHGTENLCGRGSTTCHVTVSSLSPWIPTPAFAQLGLFSDKCVLSMHFHLSVPAPDLWLWTHLFLPQTKSCSFPEDNSNPTFSYLQANIHPVPSPPPSEPTIRHCKLKEAGTYFVLALKLKVWPPKWKTDELYLVAHW